MFLKSAQLKFGDLMTFWITWSTVLSSGEMLENTMLFCMVVSDVDLVDFTNNNYSSSEIYIVLCHVVTTCLYHRHSVQWLYN